MIISMIIIAGCLHAGTVLYKKIKSKHSVLSKIDSNKEVEEQNLVTSKENAQKKEMNENFVNSLISLGFASAGNILALPSLTFLSGVGVLYNAVPVFKKTKEAIFNDHRIRIEILDSIAVVAALAGGYFFTSNLAMIVFSAAERLKFLTENRSMKSLVKVFGEKPEFVWILKDSVEVQMPFESIKAGDIIVVNAGEPIPVDGVIITGIASIDQQALTGESQPAEKSIGETVLASTVVISGRLSIRVEKAGKETVASKVSEILEKTADFTSHIESQGQAIADKSVIPVLTLSVLAYPVAGPSGTIALLSSDFLDNMRIVAPISMLNFLRAASENGILIKDGRSLQQLPKIDTVVFDKTGTLTMEQPHVGKIYTFNGMEENRVLALAAAAEYRQKHPAARAIIEKAKERRLTIPKRDKADYKIGYGISVKLDGKVLSVGSERFMKMKKIKIPAEFEEIGKNSQQQGLSLIYTALENSLIGVIELKPTIRPEVPYVLERLKKRGISFYIISGDHEKPTLSMAKTLGIDFYFAQVLPEEKAGLIEQLQKEGKEGPLSLTHVLKNRLEGESLQKR